MEDACVGVPDSMEDAYVGIHGVGNFVGRRNGRGVIIGQFVGFATGSVLVLASGVVFGVCLCVEVLGVGCLNDLMENASVGVHGVGILVCRVAVTMHTLGFMGQ